MRPGQRQLLMPSTHQSAANCREEVTALSKDQGAERTEHARDTDPDRASGPSAERAGAAHDRVRAGYSDPEAKETQQAGEKPRGATAGLDHRGTTGVDLGDGLRFHTVILIGLERACQMGLTHYGVQLADNGSRFALRAGEMHARPCATSADCGSNSGANTPAKHIGSDLSNCLLDNRPNYW